MKLYMLKKRSDVVIIVRLVTGIQTSRSGGEEEQLSGGVKKSI